MFGGLEVQSTSRTILRIWKPLTHLTFPIFRSLSQACERHYFIGVRKHIHETNTAALLAFELNDASQNLLHNIF